MVSNRFTILFEADHGLDMQHKLEPTNLPDIVLMDINMPIMDGFESVKWLQDKHPSVKVLVISMVEQEETIVKMLKLGVRGYLCKDVEPQELGEALEAVNNKGYYYTDFVTGKLVHSIQHQIAEKKKDVEISQITSQEKNFLQLTCSELTYAEIADQMCLSPKTIDGYRNSLFEKLRVKSRVGLVLFAIRNQMVPWENPKQPTD